MPKLEDVLAAPDAEAAPPPSKGPSLDDVLAAPDTPLDPELAKLSDEVGTVGQMFNTVFPGAVDSPRGAEVRRRRRAAMTPEDIERENQYMYDFIAKERRQEVETGLQGIAAGLTGGWSLAPRVAMMAGAGGLGSLTSESFDPSGGMKEAAERAGLNALLSGGGELAFGMLSKPFSGIFKPTAAGAAAAQAIEKEGGVLTPALQSESRLAKNLESIAESSFGGSNAIAAARESGQKAALAPIGRFVDDLRSGFSKEELGGIAQDALEGQFDAFKAATAAAYGEVDKVLAAAPKVAGQPAVSVSLRTLKAEAEKMMKSGLPSANAMRQLKDVLALPDEVSFQAGAEIRSALINPVSETGQLLVGNAKGQVKRLAALADRAMNDSFASSSIGRQSQREVLSVWRDANQMYREGAELFNAKMVKALVSKEPEAVVKAIAQAQKPGTIRTLKAAIGDDKVWRGIQGQFLDDLLRNSTDTAGDVARGTVVSGQKMATALKNFGDDALNELLGAERAAGFKNMVKILERSQQRTGAGLGGLNFRGGAEGVGIAMVLAGNPKGIVLTLTPWLIGKLFTHKTSVRILTQGINARPGSTEAARAMAQLIAMYGKGDPDAADASAP